MHWPHAPNVRGRSAPAYAPHFCETEDEESFTCHGTGPLADYLKHLGIWDESIPAPGVRPIDLFDRAGLLHERTLLAHANYVTDEDITRIARSGASVVYCPRTHAAFRHAPHRFRQMRDAGINVAVGTDSLASNSDLSIMGELHFLHNANPDLPADELLAMGTLHGARALGLERCTGSIEPGKRADLVVIPLEPSDAGKWTSLWDKKRTLRQVYVAGTEKR